MNPWVANREVDWATTVTLLDPRHVFYASLRVVQAWQSPMMLLQNYILTVVDKYYNTGDGWEGVG